MIAEWNLLFLGVLIGLGLFILLARKPELSLAILFNGTFIYFYLIYKMGFETNRLLSGGFYAFLAFLYIVGGVLLIAKRQKFRFELIDILFICFFFWIFLSYFLFHTGRESAYIKITYAPLLVIAPYFGIRFLSSEERIKKFFNYCVFVAAILIVPSLYELLFNPVLAESTRFSMYMFERGNNPILYGITFANLLIILFVWCLEQRKLKFKHLVLMIPSMFLLLRSGSRGAVISFFVVMLFYIFIMGRLKLKTKAYAIVFIALLIWSTYKFIPESVVEFYKYTLTPEAREDSTSSVYQRIIAWKEAINDFKANPILGVGVGNSVEGTGFPHNIILEVSAELGILGLFLFLPLCYLTIKKAMVFMRKKETSELIVLIKISLLLFIYSLVGAMFSGYITNQTRLFMSMGLVVSLISYSRGKIHFSQQ
jgi:O-antigen ligase